MLPLKLYRGPATLVRCFARHACLPWYLSGHPMLQAGLAVGPEIASFTSRCPVCVALP